MLPIYPLRCSWCENPAGCAPQSFRCTLKSLAGASSVHFGSSFSG